MSLNKILNQRTKDYGDFKEFSYLSQDLKQRVNLSLYNREPMNEYKREALSMILHKIARIVNGNENKIDSWQDIAGYATLVVEQLEKEQNERIK